MNAARPTLLLLLALAPAGAGIIPGIPSADSIANFKPPASTRIYDCKGRVIFDFYQEKRRPVPLDSIPKCLSEAVIAIEDRRFYSHWGLDLARLPGLVMETVRKASIRGTSTITQQLARSMFLTPERSLNRKVKEAALAVEIERRYSKREILELYFNQIWFGGSVYGVEAAAEKYFGRTAARLSPAECATLGAMLANPSVYSPYNHPDRLLRRRDFFLAKMKQIGCITPHEYDAAVATPIQVLPPGSARNEAPYFVEAVRRYCIDRYGFDFVYRSGSAIHTTLDLDIQRAANQALLSRLEKLETERGLKPTWTVYDSTAKVDSTVGPPRYLQGALVVLDPKTGAVRAWIGGRDFRHSEYDRVTQARRQAGSAFKPFLYVAAIDNGMTAADIAHDTAVTISIPGQPAYRPHNYDRKYMGAMTLRRALALSRNCIAVRLIQQVGPELVVRYANLMGITTKLQPYYSLALGSVEVNLLDLTNAFNTIANQGVRVKPILITRIEDSHGSTVEENRPEEQRAVRPQAAYVVASMMQSAVNEGTAGIIRSLGYEGPAAGKTGTTDDYTDTWFIGFTPEYTCGVWVAYDKKRPIFTGATGGSVSAPVWGELMKAIKPAGAAAAFSAPDSITTAPICELTGQLASPACPRVRYEVFITGSEPTAPCPIHH